MRKAHATSKVARTSRLHRARRNNYLTNERHDLSISDSASRLEPQSRISVTGRIVYADASLSIIEKA